MASFIRGLNARIRAHPVLNYVCSTHFWGPASNFGIPLAAIADAQKSPELISGSMTGALTVYSATFMRYALAVTPKNYLLFACHTINLGSQLTQGYRWMQFHKGGGKEAELARRATSEVEDSARQVGHAVKEESAAAAGKVVDGASRVAERAREVVGK